MTAAEELAALEAERQAVFDAHAVAVGRARRADPPEDPPEDPDVSELTARIALKRVECDRREELAGLSVRVAKLRAKAADSHRRFGSGKRRGDCNAAGGQEKAADEGLLVGEVGLASKVDEVEARIVELRTLLKES